MSILLTILRILGILLLVILGIIIFILLLVLLIPVHYRMYGDIQDGEMPVFNAKVSWLYPVVSVKASYNKELSLAVRLLGILIFPKKEKPENITKENKDKAESENAVINPDTDESNVTAEGTVSGKSDPPEMILNPDSPETEDSTADKNNIFEKIEHLKEKLTFYLDLLYENNTKDYISKVFNVLKKIIKHIIPKKMSADFRIGTDDPALTANILAIHGMLYPWVGDNIRIDADFENKVIEGNAFLKGRIRIGSLITQVLRLVLDRRLYKLLKQLKKGGKTDERK